MRPRRTVKIPLKRAAARPRATTAKLPARAARDEAEIEDYEGESEPNMRFSHALFVVLILHVIAVAGVFAFNSIKTRQTESAKSAPAPIEGDLPAREAAKPVAKTAAPAAPTAQKSQPTEKTPAATPAGRTHVVAAGDTLTRIAATYKTTIPAIEEANKITAQSMLRIGQTLVIPDPKTATRTSGTPGAVVAKPLSGKAIIPSVPKAASAASSAPAGNTPAAPSAKRPTDGIYEVARGDNPYAIAKRFNVSYKQLLQINNIEDPRKIQIGQKLKLP